MTREFKKQGPAQTKFPKKYIIRCALQMLWVKISLTINWSKMKYNDLKTQVNYIIKWPPKHRIVLSIKKNCDKKLSLEWYSRRAVLIGWVKNSLDAFVAPCYGRKRAFRGTWWLIRRIYCNIKVPSVKNGYTKCAWGRNNWTVGEGGFRSCHCLRSFSSMRCVWWGWIVAQN